MARENFQRAYLTLTPPHIFKFKQIGNVPTIIKVLFAVYMLACIMNKFISVDVLAS